MEFIKPGENPVSLSQRPVLQHMPKHNGLSYIKKTIPAIPGVHNRQAINTRVS
jgi:hypothetical protein